MRPCIHTICFKLRRLIHILISLEATVESPSTPSLRKNRSLVKIAMNKNAKTPPANIRPDAFSTVVSIGNSHGNSSPE